MEEHEPVEQERDRVERDDPVATVRSAAQAAGLGGRDSPQEDVVVLVSGGRDSVCLLHVAVALLGVRRVHALHVNYALRDSAAGDEQLCRDLCAELGVTLEVRHPQRPADAHGNLQAWARDMRYAAATRLADQHGALVLTGHTATDQVETILYRLAASPGRRALLGMPQRRGRLLRPLLAVTRAQTAAYCLAAGLAWHEDPTNDSDVFARGRVRNGLVPALREIHPAAEANVLRTAQLLGEEAALLDALVDEVLAGRDRVALTTLAGLSPAPSRGWSSCAWRRTQDRRPPGGVGDRLAGAGRAGRARWNRRVASRQRWPARAGRVRRAAHRRRCRPAAAGARGATRARRGSLRRLGGAQRARGGTRRPGRR